MAKQCLFKRLSLSLNYVCPNTFEVVSITRIHGEEQIGCRIGVKGGRVMPGTPLRLPVQAITQEGGQKVTVRADNSVGTG
jgi:hypothetical protein